MRSVFTSWNSVMYVIVETYGKGAYQSSPHSCLGLLEGLGESVLFLAVEVIESDFSVLQRSDIVEKRDEMAWHLVSSHGATLRSSGSFLLLSVRGLMIINLLMIMQLGTEFKMSFTVQACRAVTITGEMFFCRKSLLHSMLM